jgi:hypothetical protein
MKTEGSGSASGSIGQRHGSSDPDPDPHQNVRDPQLWGKHPTVLGVELSGPILSEPNQTYVNDALPSLGSLFVYFVHRFVSAQY